MLTVWGRTNSINVQKVIWACEELGLAYRREEAGGRFGVVDTPEFAAMNPNRLVPVIDDDGFVLWESNTIVRYLAAVHATGGLMPETPAARADAERWMDWASLTAIPAVNAIFVPLVRTPAEQRDEAAIEAAKRKAEEVWRVVEQALAGRSYITGDGLTVGDIPLGAAAYRWMAMDFVRPSLPRLEAWYGRLAAREPFRRGVMVPLS